MKPSRLPQARGFTLMELLLIIIVLGIAAGSVMNVATRSGTISAEMLREQQMLAVASSLLDEVNSMPFTYCDPDDANAPTAPSPAGCGVPEVLGPEGGETRLVGGTPRFDNVTDYNGYVMPGPGCTSLCDITGAPLSVANGGNMAACTAAVAVTPTGVGGTAALDAGGWPQSVRVRVTVACPGLASIALESFRLRYAPNRF
ncbi:MAG: type II secretion system protein [Aquabacterium sp.]|nr:MAG: type II secretion system protein [Aquabacterium sp.]